MKKVLGAVLLLLIAGALLAEVAARHLIDLKLYGADAELGYWVLPDQHGDSALTGSFAFDHTGLGVAEPFRLSPRRTDVLLLGDSIVLGASGLRQEQRLGPVIEAQTGWNVWPMSAGSWAMWNELRVVDRHPELRSVDAIVLVVNDGDFARPSEWRSELTHPRSLPWSYAIYAVRKKLAGPTPKGVPPFPVRRSDLQADWERFLAQTPAKVMVVGYAALNTAGTQCRWRPAWLDRTVPFVCYDVAAHGGRKLVVDGTHPNAAGDVRFARFIEAAAREKLHLQ